MIIQISAGQGPAECQLAIAKLFKALEKEYGDLEILWATDGYEKGCYDSICFQTGQDLRALEGTVLWVCKSPFRRDHKRKNWYVDVSVIPEQMEIAANGEYRMERFQCGGKGGQHVNKVETGVRIIHVSTGLAARSTEERSQLQNKQRAMRRLQEKLFSLRQEQEAKQVRAAWRKHAGIVRGNPVRIYQGERFILKG